MQKLLRINDWPLATKLIISIISLSGLTLLASTSVGTLLASNDLEAGLQPQFVTTAQAVASESGTILQSEVSLLKGGLASSSIIRAAAAESNSSYTGSDPDIKAQILSLDTQWVAAPASGNDLIYKVEHNSAADQLRLAVKEDPLHAEYILTDRYGAAIATSDRSSDYYQADEEWWQAAWNNGQGTVYIGPPQLDASSNTLSVEIVVPVLGSDGGSPIGVIKVVYNIQALIDQVSKVKVGQTGHVQIVTPDGRFVFGPNKISDVGKAVPTNYLLGGKIFKQSGFEQNITDPNGQPVILGYAPVTTEGEQPEVDKLGWVVELVEPRSEAFAPINQFGTANGAIGFVALLITGGLAVFLSRFIARQVNEIEQVFRAAAVGNFDARAKVFGHDELGRTAQGVNAMLEQMSSLIGTAAKAAQQRFSDVVTTMADWVWEVDAQGRYTYCSDNVVNVLGYTKAEVIGKSPFDFMPPEEAQRVGSKFGELLAAKQPLIELENKNLHKDGHEVILLTNGVPILDDQGNLTGYRGTDKDITAQKQAQERIRENEATLRGIFDNMQDAFYRTDLQGRIIWASPSAAKMLGYGSVEDVIGLDTATAFWAHPDQRDSMLKILQTSGKVADYEVEIRCKDGSTFPVSTSSSYYRDANGQIAGVEGAFRDITQRKQAEEAIQSSERLLRSIVDATKDWIFLKDTNYRYMVVNEAFAYEYGRLTPQEMIGKDDYDLGTPAYLIEGDPERGIRGFRTDDRAVVVDKQTITNPYDVVNFRDGAEHIFHTVKAPLYNAQDEIIGVLGVSRDITERKQAEDQLEEQNKTLATTLEELRGLMAGVESAAGQVTGASGSLQAIVELIVGQAATSAEMAERATGSAQEGGEAVSNTVSAMGRIRETTQETARRIKKLGEVSQEIGEVVRLIDEIADRVTVLALNASIQAAAAGDAGRGFAVVAEEVQRLAERATGATRQIENLIKGVQGEINEAMVSVEEVTQEVVGGSQLAQDAGDRMNDLSRVVGDLAALIEHLSQTTSRQTSQSLATLTALAEDLRESVAALRTPEEEATGGNGHGNGAHTTVAS